MEKKHETFVYEGLGFPVELIDCPMKKIHDEWVLDINMAALQRFVFQGLIHKPYPLTGKEIRFMRKFLGLSTTEFGDKLGVSHATVVKWENEQSKIAPAQESYIRLFLCELFNEHEILRLYKEIRPETLAKAKLQKPIIPFQVKAKELDAANF
jgi:DNA-binding transcriptional regulator YiaG